MELSEILTALREHIGDDAKKAKDVAQQLRNTVQPVAQVLIDVGAGRKAGETTAEVKRIEQERDAAIAERDEARTELDEVKQKTPDAAEIEKRVTAKLQPKLDAAEKKATEAGTKLTEARKQGKISEFVAAMVATQKIDPDYAKETLASKYGDRFVVREDGRVDVLQLGKAEAYAPGDDTTEVELLAADVRKTVAPKFVTVDVDTGAGLGADTGVGSGSGYDPVKAGREQGKAQRAANTAQADSLALR